MGLGAARHGARLALLSAVFDTMPRSVAWTGETSINLVSTSAMQEAEVACSNKGGAVFHFAQFLAATAMLAASSSCCMRAAMGRKEGGGGRWVS